MKDLIKRVKMDDERAIKELMAEYPNVISKAFYAEMGKGRVSSSFSINAEHLLEDIESISWADFFQQLKNKDRPEEENLPALLRIIAARRTIDAIDKSIKRREAKAFETKSNVQQNKERGSHLNNIFSKDDGDMLEAEISMARSIHSPEEELLALEAINQFESVITERQRQIIDLVIDGKTTEEIAELLGITRRTVSSDIATIKEALRS